MLGVEEAFAMPSLDDFFFIGAAVLPVVLLLAGEPVFAALSSVALCIAGGLATFGDPQAPHRRPPRN